MKKISYVILVLAIVGILSGVFLSTQKKEGEKPNHENDSQEVEQDSSIVENEIAQSYVCKTDVHTSTEIGGVGIGEYQSFTEYRFDVLEDQSFSNTKVKYIYTFASVTDLDQFLEAFHALMSNNSLEIGEEQVQRDELQITYETDMIIQPSQERISKFAESYFSSLEKMNFSCQESNEK